MAPARRTAGRSANPARDRLWLGRAVRHSGRGAASSVTAISLSDEQLAWARAHHPGVEFRKQDYRQAAGQYDGIVSVEMVEALGREYWPAFMDCIARNLKPGGRAAIQFIAMDDALFEGYARSADFIQAYVFPGGLLIKTERISSARGAAGAVMEGEEAFGGDYAETLKAWRARFDHAVEHRRLPLGFDRRFCDLWRYYLAYCEGGFRGGRHHCPPGRRSSSQPLLTAVVIGPAIAREDIVVHDRAEHVGESAARQVVFPPHHFGLQRF